MEGKLIKIENNYHLENNGDIMAGSHIADRYKYKLSIKNCEAIENGYDLDKLAKDYAINQLANPNEYEHSIYASTIQNTYMVGFQKALEILGDKKFSEYDIRKAYNTNHYSAEDKEENWSTFFKQLQPKEWDVEIVMIYGFDDINDPKPFSIPKLDSDGCLILKRR